MKIKEETSCVDMMARSGASGEQKATNRRKSQAITALVPNITKLLNPTEGVCKMKHIISFGLCYHSRLEIWAEYIPNAYLWMYKYM